MTCTQLFVIRCDHKWLEGDFVRRCKNEILGDDREISQQLKDRVRGYGWLIGDGKHLCVWHRDE